MTTDLKQEADALVIQAAVANLLTPYPGWFIGGSYGYDLMCWRDLDVYILDPEHDLKRCFAVGYEITSRLSAPKAFFTNNLGGEPNGFYWGIRLGDTRRGAWKLDCWFLDEAGYVNHAEYSKRMRERLTPRTRDIILAIKQRYWSNVAYRDTITSDLIYRAVLEHGITTIERFEDYLKTASNTSPGTAS